MARPERFELPTPRFVVWGPSLKSLRFVTERNRLLNGRPIFGATAKAVVTEKNLNEGEREGFSLPSPKPNVFEGFELPLDHSVYVCDGWAELKTPEIIVKHKDWLSTVAVTSPRRPIIYTRSNYWRDMLGEAGFDLIKPYAIWLAQ